MAEASLSGLGVLVTRPAHQAGELVAAIEAAGGRAIRFPTIEIVPRNDADVERDAADLGEPDIVIFVSANAVRFGLGYAGSASVAAVGPATAAAIEAAGRDVDIRPAEGFDSEHLLAEAALEDVGGKTVRIVRGNSGRELIADTLRGRGAIVEYLAVYERRAPAADTGEIERAWQAMFDLNVMSGVRLSRALMPDMLARGWGRIIFIGSDQSSKPNPSMSHYAMTKTALVSIARSLAELTRDSGVTVNTVQVAPTWTDGVDAFMHQMAEIEGTTPEEMSKAYFAEGEGRTSLLQRWAEPAEIANVVAFLCSPRASAINGSAPRADGGMVRALF